MTSYVLTPFHQLLPHYPKSTKDRYSGSQILVQTHVSDAIRGRVMGALALSFGLTPVGSLLIGELAQSFGAPLGVALGALASSLCVAIVGWHYREILRL